MQSLERLAPGRMPNEWMKKTLMLTPKTQRFCFGLLVICSMIAPVAAKEPVGDVPPADIPAGDITVAERNRQQVQPASIAGQIDSLLTEEFANAETARQADDYAFLRRVSLDLVGMLPTPEEIHRFVQNKSTTKRLDVVDQLLDDPRFGENWGRYWRDVIFYRRSEDRALVAADTTANYVAEQLNAGRPWDQIAASFVTASGDIRQQGETGIIAAQAGRPEETVAELSRIFMGIQIQCAQCHDHPFDSWEREQFHELAAFFPRVGMRANKDGNKRTFVVFANDATRKRRTNPNRHIPTPEHYMSDLDDPGAQGTLMTPTFFVSGQSLDLGASDDERRSALAQWMTSPDNEWFAKALVNRLWSELMGVGFYEPVDDIGPERDAAAEKALDLLSAEFVKAGYDVKWLFRTIMSTKAYNRSSVSRSATSDPSAFLTTNPQRMRADQLFNAISYALFIDDESVSRKNGSSRKYARNPRMLFSAVFGYDPSDVRSEITGSVPQALMLMNSPLLSKLMSARRSAGLGRLLKQHSNDRELVKQLYLRCFSRPPTPTETKIAIKHLRLSESRADGFEDLLWALINSAEFSYRT